MSIHGSFLIRTSLELGIQHRREAPEARGPFPVRPLAVTRQPAITTSTVQEVFCQQLTTGIPQFSEPILLHNYVRIHFSDFLAYITLQDRDRSF